MSGRARFDPDRPLDMERNHPFEHKSFLTENLKCQYIDFFT